MIKHQQMLRRRVLLGAAAWLAAPFATAQQPAATTRVLGILSPNRAPTPEQIAKGPYQARLRELGWFEGKNLRVERAYGGSEERLPQLAAELVKKRVDVIWAAAPDAATAAARATKTIPIVFWGVADPVAQGLVDSLARPGRNVTGVTFSDGGEISQKRLEILKEIVPAARRVAWIRFRSVLRSVTSDSALPPSAISAAQKLGIELQQFPVERQEELEAVFKGILAARTQAMNVGQAALAFRERSRILDFADRNRIPAMYGDRTFVEAGGLASYGADEQSIILQSLTYVDRVLRGAKPADMPVALPTTYELWLNLKTARALGLTIPKLVILRANRVIE